MACDSILGVLPKEAVDFLDPRYAVRTSLYPDSSAATRKSTASLVRLLSSSFDQQDHPQSAQCCQDQEGSQFPQYIRLIREEYEVVRTP